MRSERFAPFVAYLAAQAFVVVGLVTPRFPDSSGYLHLSFSGHAPRLWTVPLLYTLVPTDGLRVAAQAAVAAAAWWFLASTAASLVADRRVRVALRVALLMLGVVGPVAEWNSTILSDSTAISLTVVLIGCWLRHASRPSARTALAVFVVTLLWTFTRNEFVLLGAGVTLVAIIASAWRVRSRLNAVLMVGLVAISSYGFLIDGRNPYVADTNLEAIVEDRILPNPAYTSWFIEHGMPDSPAIQSTAGGIWGVGLAAIPSFTSWATAHGMSTYAEFMVTHPGYTLLGPLPDFTGERASVNEPNRTPYVYTQPNPTPSMISPTANYGRHRDVLPSVVADLLFEQGQIGDVLLLASAAFGLAWFARRKLGPDGRLWIPMMLAFSAIPQGYMVWLLGGEGDTDRHGTMLAIVLRIGLWMVLAFAADRIIRAREPGGRSAAL